MTSSHEVRLTPDARRDVRDILRRTLRTWGQSQHDVYAERLQESLRRLSQFPEIGHARQDLPTGLRRYLSGEHVIYYRIDDAAVTVTRILHRRMSTAVLDDE